MNDPATPVQVCPHIRIHAIDIDQPPGIGISPMADMETHPMIVAAVLAAKSNAQTLKKARREALSHARTLIRHPDIYPSPSPSLVTLTANLIRDAAQRLSYSS
jgi:hypothetical protein